MAANTTPLTYNGYVTQIGTMAVVQTTTVNGIVQGVDEAFNAIIPQMLNYAELRIQRDLDLLELVTTSNYILPVDTNFLSISIDDFVTVQTIEWGTYDYDREQININAPVLPTTKQYIQNVFSNDTAKGPPLYFAMYGGDRLTGGNTTSNILFGPYADINYPLLVTGTIRMPTLYESATTPLAATGTTFISTYLPDLLIMASMVYISAYQRNFGRMSDDPTMALSYESQYQALVKAAGVEEYRKKFEASAWSSNSTSQAATP